MSSPHTQFEAALRIVEALRADGHQAYFAGGCVRDLLLGRIPLTTMWPPPPRPASSSTSSRAPSPSAPTSASCSSPRTRRAPSLEARPTRPDSVTEVATFRRDGAYSEAAIPTRSATPPIPKRTSSAATSPSTACCSIPLKLAQLSRISSRPPSAQEVLDYVNGLADLDAGIVRAIGDPAVASRKTSSVCCAPCASPRVSATPSRPHPRRHPRLAPAFTPSSASACAMNSPKCSPKAAPAAPSNCSTKPVSSSKVLPEISSMKGVQQPPQFHPEGDVLIHTMLLLQQLPPRCPRTLAWGALLHDVGKPPTFRVAPDRIRFDGHVEVGVAMAAEICRRFRFSNEETRQILALVENHMRFADAPRMKASTLKRFFRLPCFRRAPRVAPHGLHGGARQP